MSEIVFNFHTDDTARGRVMTLGEALRCRLNISLIIDGQTIGQSNISPIGLCASSRLKRFLRRYRQDPDNTEPSAWVRDQLHQLLFAGRKFDGLFGKSIHDASRIVVKGPESLSRLIGNIPWELADGINGEAAQLMGTLAALPLTRQMPKTRARLKLKAGGPLQVTYAIARPPHDTALDAPAFEKILDRILSAREGLVRSSSLIGSKDGSSDSPNYGPTYAQILGEIDKYPPHILILVAHGQTVNGVGRIYLNGPNGFEWFSLVDLGKVLVDKNQTFLVFLIACDQAFQDDTHAAQSGALSLLEGGVPWVVAMQSKVMAVLAEGFLGTALDHLFQSANLAGCVAAARCNMQLPSKPIDGYADWSFPGLFASENAQQFERLLDDYLQKFSIKLVRLRQGIPSVEPYFPRKNENIDDTLRSWMEADACGVRFVRGPFGRGKSFAIRFACITVLDSAIAADNLKVRPVLYCDLDHGEIRDARTLLEKIGVLNSQLRSQFSDVAPFKWAIARGVDGQGTPMDAVEQLVELIDYNHMVLVVDNISDEDPFPWNDLFQHFKRLHRSLVVVAKEALTDQQLQADEILPVWNLDEQETIGYAANLAPSCKSEAKQWYEDTGGILLLLNQVSRGVDPDFRASRRARALEDRESYLKEDYAQMFASRISPKLMPTCQILSVLPNGISSGLADWLNLDVEAIQQLESDGVLTRDHRYENEIRWQMPRVIRDIVTGKLQEKFCRDFATMFVEKVSKAGDVCQVLNQLCRRPGGVELVLDAQLALLEANMKETAKVIPLLLHRYLFRHGRWMDALLLYRRYLDAVPQDQTPIGMWINRAKAAHLFGYGDEASQCLGVAESMHPSDFDRISILDLRASLIKDSGSLDREEEALEYYRESHRLLAKSTASLDEGSADGFTIEDLREKKALILYNEAHFQNWWQHKMAEAVESIELAIPIFAELKDHNMEALSIVALVDFELGRPSTEKNWDKLLERLINSCNVLAKQGAEAHGDAAFAWYTLAKFYRRCPASDTEVIRQNLHKAQSAYSECKIHAQKAGDLRQEMIARAHEAEVAWADLHSMDGKQALEILDDACAALRAFNGDRWSLRVLRNSLILSSQILQSSDQNTAIELLKQGLSVATTSPLTPDRGTDARRTAKIIHNILTLLDENGRALEIDRLTGQHLQLIKSWLGKTVRIAKRHEWMTELAEFADTEEE